jgi:2-oxoglutarate dehydrogenase E2 component (dihydrolipoamide succinyltransferase)
MMNVLMPQLGETVTQGTVVAWHKKEGDQVSKDEILADVETDKAAVEIPAPSDGVISSVLVQEGETVDVGTVLVVINGPDGTAEDSSDSATDEQPKTDSSSEAPESSDSGKRPSLSPAVRRLIAEHRLEADAIPASGRGGRLTRSDVMSFIESRAVDVSAEPAESAPDQTRPSALQPAVPSFSDGDRVPFDRIRRVTAEHMVRSKATSPHVLQAVEADFSAVEFVRSQSGERWRADHGFSLTYLPFIAQAVCIALRDFPRLNSSVDGDSLVLHKRIHLSVAVDLNFEGLVAPVIQDADGLTVSGLALRIHEISARAREGKLSADEFTGGTYTLSNNGSFGTLLTGAIINQPQVAILSIDAIKKRPMVIEGSAGDSIGIRPIGILSQSFDHRAVDGAYSAAFLQKIKTLLEEKNWSAEL